MVNVDPRPSEEIGQLPDDVLTTQLTIDLTTDNLLYPIYSYQDEWSLPIETVAPAYSCHQ